MAAEHKPIKGSAETLNQSAGKVRELLLKRYDHPPLAYIHTYGCQQNVSDGEKIKGMLALMGYGFTENSREAELILYNTCAVRENAEDRIFGNVGALKGQKKHNPNLIIALCGCMVQQEHISDKIRQSYPFVDLVLGTHMLAALPETLYRVLSERKRVFDISSADETIHEELPTKRDQTMKAWLPIMYGCNNFCTYCVVPYVRGRERSRESKAILEEFTSLVKSGCKEIMLLGQNVNSYGLGLDESIDFAGLLRRLNQVPGDFRIRFMSSHPKDATFELIDTIAECDKVCSHFHLPVQSGSDRILALMNRHYTVEQYLRLIEYAKKKVPDISFTSDIIVGFPGETEEDFEQTLSLIRTVEYDSLFSFIYSKREGTKAAEMEDSTPPEVKSERFQHLLETQREIGAGKCSEAVGRTLRVLIDGEGRTGEGYLTGRTEQNMIVDFPGSLGQIGQFARIRITKALNWALLGEQVGTCEQAL